MNPETARLHKLRSIMVMVIPLFGARLLFLTGPLHPDMRGVAFLLALCPRIRSLHLLCPNSSFMQVQVYHVHGISRATSN
jgi:hypothetical protein